jgi:hypothetical protein
MSDTEQQKVAALQQIHQALIQIHDELRKTRMAQERLAVVNGGSVVHPPASEQ